MATVDLKTAQEIKNGNGFYKGEGPQVRRIVAYDNAFDGRRAYGLEYGHEIGRYMPSHYVRNPTVFFDATHPLGSETGGGFSTVQTPDGVNATAEE